MEPSETVEGLERLGTQRVIDEETQKNDLDIVREVIKVTAALTPRDDASVVRSARD